MNGAEWMKPEGPDSNISQRMTHPVVQVSWNDANAYCKWRGKRLPTEAEWEYAASGGLSHPTFCWGNETLLFKNGEYFYPANTWQGKFPDFNSKDDGYYATSPSKSFPSNGFGLYNMCGNVWEWTSDWFRTKHKKKELAKNPKGPKRGKRKVQKGGSFLCHPSYCFRFRVSSRIANTPDSTSNNVGFRCSK